MNKKLTIINEKSFKKIIQQGEDSITEFKRDKINQTSLTQTIVAFANKKGGRIIFGVKDDKQIVGIKNEKEIEKLIFNSINNIKPLLSFEHYNQIIDNKLVIYLEIPNGDNKPYATNDGKYFIRHGASKRQMSQEELLRAFQTKNRLRPEEMIIQGASLSNINLQEFKNFYKEKFQQEIDINDKEYIKNQLENTRCCKDDSLTLLGVLLFCDTPQKFVPSFNIKAVAYEGIEDTGSLWRSSDDINGNLKTQYNNAMNFINTNLPKQQTGKSFNSQGKALVSKIVLEELLTNALTHRDYLKDSPIRIFIFNDRIEIKSPGKLPNNLTIKNIEHGVAIQKNPILCAHISTILPYKGMGTGIRRAKKEIPEIEFINNEEIEEFTAIIPLLKKEKKEKPKELMPFKIKSTLNLLIGNFNYLKDLLIIENFSLEKELRFFEEKLTDIETQKERSAIIKSGTLNYIKGFIENLENLNLEIGEAFKAIKKNNIILANFKKQYNEIAHWTKE